MSNYRQAKYGMAKKDATKEALDVLLTVHVPGIKNLSEIEDTWMKLQMLFKGNKVCSVFILFYSCLENDINLLS